MMAIPKPQDPTVSVRAHEDNAILTRHGEFYFTDEMTVFQVESRLFRVHRYFLVENSLVFSSMFSLPPVQTRGPTSTREGTCDANPIHLPGVTELEFETLLRYFYKSIHDSFSLSRASWIALLSISHRYDFPNVYKRAIREVFDESKIEEKDHSLLVSVAERYDVPSKHAFPLLVAIVKRQQPLTEGEVANLSALTVSRLAQAREEFVRETHPLANPFHGAGPDATAKRIVSRIWQVSIGQPEANAIPRGSLLFHV